MTGAELEALVGRCLEEGVPPGVVSRVFDLDHDLVKKTQSGMRVRDYNTDDMGEYLERLRWATIADAFRVLQSGSAAERARVHAMILGKEMAVSARRTPESVRNSQAAVLDLLEGMRVGVPKVPKERSKFIAQLDDTEVDAEP